MKIEVERQKSVDIHTNKVKMSLLCNLRALQTFLETVLISLNSQINK